MDGLGAGSTLSGIVDDVTFANISRRELKSAGYDAAESLVKLLQLCVEYMLHVQESLINDASKAELGRRKALDEVSDVEAKLSLEKARRRAAARQCVDFREVALALAGARAPPASTRRAGSIPCGTARRRTTTRRCWRRTLIQVLAARSAARAL